MLAKTVRFFLYCIQSIFNCALIPDIYMSLSVIVFENSLNNINILRTSSSSVKNYMRKCFRIVINKKSISNARKKVSLQIPAFAGTGLIGQSRRFSELWIPRSSRGMTGMGKEDNYEEMYGNWYKFILSNLVPPY